MTTTDRFPLIGRDDLVALTDAVVSGAGTAPPAILLIGEAGRARRPYCATRSAPPALVCRC